MGRVLCPFARYPRLRPGTAIAVHARRDQRRRALLAGGLWWLSTPLQGQAIIDAALSTGSTTRDPLHAEVARIEQYGSKYVLTTYCRGTHSIYVQPTAEFDPRDYAGKYVRVAYEHIEVQEGDIKCVRAPCGPVTVTSAVILKLEQIDVSEAELDEFRRTCSPP